jgi:hypothetical protein
VYRHLKYLYANLISFNADAVCNQLGAHSGKCIVAIAMRRSERAAGGSSVPPL